MVLDKYATHKHPKVPAWLVRHPRWTFHFTRPRHPGSTVEHNANPKPFQWAKSADAILAKLDRLPVTSI
jgi:hypothetical protein